MIFKLFIFICNRFLPKVEGNYILVIYFFIFFYFILGWTKASPYLKDTFTTSPVPCGYITYVA